ncbi:MAG: ABC transporter ATP-binding protein [Oscillospiraceae bacterium]|jgi:ATP-binding cassette subfamily B protein|nr:ABC transporter ATP-binding protein [Oscillospiraceae bacterium]
MTAVFKHCSKKLLLCYALICPFATVTSTAFAMSLQPIIDVGLTGDGRAFVTTTAAAVIIACLSELSFYIENIIKNGVVISYTKNLRIHYFRTFFQQDIARFLEKDSAEYLSKLTVDAEVIGQKYCESMLRLYKSLWSLAISSVCIASARWELAIYVLVISCISVNLPRLFQGKANASEQDYLESSSAHIKLAQESIRNYLVIRLFKLRPSQLEQYEQAVSAVERRDNTRKKRAFAVDAAAGAISSIGFILVIALCMVFVLQGKLSVGYTMSVSQLLGGIQFPFEILPGYLVAYRSGRDLYWTNEAELQKDVKAEGGKTLRLTPTDNRMEINQVSFSYNTDHPAILDGVSLSLDLKKKYAVVGESGSGKSTLAKIVMGLLEPSCGAVWLNGVPLCEIDKSSLYDVIAYQDQSASFFNGTIKENIVLGEQLPENTWRQIITASCLDGLLDKLPEGEFTVIEENGKNISGGEAQRICLARCLARRPSFIIFDEIAAALDTQNAAAIEKSILSLENTGILQITHRIAEENMRQYDSIFVLKGGRIAEQGTWDDLVAQKGEFYRLLIHSSEPAV